jgi:hypothetical protein
MDRPDPCRNRTIIEATVPIRLTYDLRRGVITGVVGSQRIELPAQPSQGSVYDWVKTQEIRTSTWTPADHAFDLPSSTRTIDAGAIGATGVATRIGSGLTNASAEHRSPSITITGPAGGFHIHGWPPCNLAGCLVVSRGWDELSRALAREGERSVDFYVVW